MKKSSRWWRCTRKFRYGSFAAADRAASELERRIKRPVSAYLCATCGHHHVGKTPKHMLERKER